MPWAPGGRYAGGAGGFRGITRDTGGGGGADATTGCGSAVPQLPQNLASSTTVDPHCAHVRAIDVPPFVVLRPTLA
jgi:hypothetical protein